LDGTTLIHYWDSKTKQESMQWKHDGSPTLNKFQTQLSAGKITAMLWGLGGILPVHCMSCKTLISGDACALEIKTIKKIDAGRHRGVFSSQLYSCTQGKQLLP
jgi:hypothetical protein